jgi:hypothetical protein
MGFYQVVRSIGLTVGSALSAAVLLAHTPHGQELPDVGGFVTTLIIAAGLCLVTAVVSFVLPGRKAPSPDVFRVNEDDREALMKGEAELAGTGLVASEELPPFGLEEYRT